MREKIIGTLGRLPQKCVLNLEFLDSAACEGYTRYTVAYNTETDERVRSFLLIPETKGEKLPAVVAAHQHAAQYHIGKSEPAGLLGDDQYYYGEELAKRGFVVICPDHLGFEERLPEPWELDMRGVDGAWNERELFCHAISQGGTLQGKYVSDLSVAVDVLCELECVDRNRIGTIGHSLGGQEALWLTFFDDRVRAGVSSCGFGTVRSVFKNHIPHNFAMFTIGGLDSGDHIALLKEIGKAGKAFMFTNGKQDRLFPMEGVEELLAARTFFEESKFEACIFEGGHSFPGYLRIKAYEFLAANLS